MTKEIVIPIALVLYLFAMLLIWYVHARGLMSEEDFTRRSRMLTFIFFSLLLTGVLPLFDGASLLK